jgi:hypothetical protein
MTDRWLDKIVGGIEYDFREDDDDVQGNTGVTLADDVLTLRYTPFPDSPYPAATERYRVTRIEDDGHA